MITDMAAQRSGVFQFTAVDGSNLVLSYHPLNANGWILLTLVPADLISGNAGAYIFRSFLLIAGGLLVLGLLFLALCSNLPGKSPAAGIRCIYRSAHRRAESGGISARLSKSWRPACRLLPARLFFGCERLQADQ